MKNLTLKGRKAIAVILTIMLVLSMTSNVFASWSAYNTGYSSNVYLEETWIGSKQSINFYKNGVWQRNVAGEGHTLYLNSIPVVYSLYDTNYWCFDESGNVFAIDTAQNLLLCRAGTDTFVINTRVTGCKGFQRDDRKIGYLLYTTNGTYSLENLLNNNYNNNYRSDNYEDNYYSYANTGYPYVEKPINIFIYHINPSKEYNYYLSDYKLHYLGTSDKSDDVVIATGVTDVTFAEGFVVYATTSGNVYAYPIGKTRSSYKRNIGTYFNYFDDSSFMSQGYYNLYGEYKKFSNIDSYYDYNYNDYEEDEYNYDDDYPYVKKSGSYYYFYTTRTKYYKYYLSGSTLYYKGTNSSSSSTRIATNVEDITFWYDGYNEYIVYADNNDKVYAYEIGKTSTSYRDFIGDGFSYFDEDDYMSEGYYNTRGRYHDFSDYDYDSDYDEDDDYYDDDYPYVKKSGSYYYFYTSRTKYYKYYLSGSSLYYKGTNSSSSSTRIATNVEDITFWYDGDNGYVVYADDDDEVYAYEIGKTSTSYKDFIGEDFDYFDEEDYMSEGYYDYYDDYIDFDF